jgi:hypothetical protein
MYVLKNYYFILMLNCTKLKMNYIVGSSKSEDMVVISGLEGALQWKITCDNRKRIACSLPQLCAYNHNAQ